MSKVILLLSGSSSFQGRISSFQEHADTCLVMNSYESCFKKIFLIYGISRLTCLETRKNFKFILAENQKFAVNMRMDSGHHKIKQ